MVEVTAQIKELSLEIGQHLEAAAEVSERISTEIEDLSSAKDETLEAISDITTEIGLFSEDIVNEANTTWTKGQQDIEEAVEATVAQLNEQVEAAREAIFQAMEQLADWRNAESELAQNRDEFLSLLVQDVSAETENWKQQAATSLGFLSGQIKLVEQLGVDLTQIGQEASAQAGSSVRVWLGEHKSKIDQFGQEQEQFVSDAFEEITTSIRSAYETETGRVQQLQISLMDSIENASTEWMETQKDKFLEALEGIVKREITEAIIVSKLGVATTGVLSPYLPALAAIKHAMDTILELIRVWREVEGAFGL
ncbi:MAG: hypothetical protein AAFP81_07255 [Pseudomonadota bacterium]